MKFYHLLLYNKETNEFVKRLKYFDLTLARKDIDRYVRLFGYEYRLYQITEKLIKYS